MSTLNWFIDKKTASPKQVVEYVGQMLQSYHRKWLGARR